MIMHDPGLCCLLAPDNWNFFQARFQGAHFAVLSRVWSDLFCILSLKQEIWCPQEPFLTVATQGPATSFPVWCMAPVFKVWSSNLKAQSSEAACCWTPSWLPGFPRHPLSSSHFVLHSRVNQTDIGSKSRCDTYWVKLPKNRLRASLSSPDFRFLCQVPHLFLLPLGQLSWSSLSLSAPCFSKHPQLAHPAK